MRILMWIGIGFALSCAVCVFILPQAWLLPAVAVSLVICALLLLGVKRWKICRIIVVLLFGVVCGFLRYGHFRDTQVIPAQSLDLTVTEARLTALDYSYETDYGYAVDAWTNVEGIRQNVRVYLDEDLRLKPGDVLSGSFRFRFAASKKGERTSYLQSNGILLIADQRGELSVSGKAEDMWRYFPAKLAGGIKEILRKAFPEDIYPFVKAVLLGDTADISYEVDTALKISGIRHVVAVSGLHVSILYGMLQTITAKKRFLTSLIGVPILILFAAVAGFTPSVTRACIMAGLMMLSQLVQKEYDGPTALSFACLVMLVLDPLAVGSVSLQLSAGCVAGIMLFQSDIKRWIDKGIRNVERNEKSRLKSWISSSVAVTLSSMSLTTPLCAAYFGTVSIVGVLTNLLTLWILNGVFIGIVITCVAGAICMSAASVIGWVLAWPIRLVLAVADGLSRLPFSAVYTSSGFIVAWLVLSYMLLALLLIMRRKPALFVSTIVLSLFLAIGFSWFEPMLYNCTVTVLDVGQGQSIIVQTEGKTFLVDCGGSYAESAADKAAAKLLSMGVGRLDAVFLTHGDEDHSGGLKYLLSRVDADAIFLSATDADTELPSTDANIIWVDRLTQVSFGNAVITVYPPPFLADNNENSLGILFDTEKYDILVTGDKSEVGEQLLVSHYEIPEVDLLVAGHHGSKYSTGEALLNVTRPDTVVISAGKDNIYGHPAQELLDRLDAARCVIRRTDEEGTIVFRR